MHLASMFWPVVAPGLYALAWFLTGSPGERVAWPVDPEDTRIYLVVGASGLIAGSALQVLARGGARTRRHVRVWTAFFICGVLTWASRAELEGLINVVRGTIQPSVALTTAQGEAEIYRGWDKHYRAEAEINGVPVRMLIDTGASMVLLPYEWARKLGIDPRRLRFSLSVITANGKSTVAPVTLSSVKIGPIAEFDVEAAVARPGMLKAGLLGMSFLEKLDETSFRGGRLILKN